MANTDGHAWHKWVRCIQRDDELLIINLENGAFLKVRGDAKPFIDLYLQGDKESICNQLSDHETKELDDLVNTLRLKGYISDVDKHAKGELSPQLTLWDYLVTPKTAYYSISDSCNLSCPFCYADPKRSATPYPGDTRRSAQIIDQLAAINVSQLILTGGEPLLRQDVLELAAHAKGLGMIVGLTTNGTLIGGECARNLAQSGIDFVQVSVESCIEEEHDALRGKGSFAKSIQAVRMLRESGLPEGRVFITATTTRSALAQVANYWDFAASIGATPTFSLYQPVGRASRSKKAHLPSADELIALMRNRIRQAQESTPKAVASKMENPPCAFNMRVINSCSMGFTTIAVKETGEVLPCHLYLSCQDFGIGNILDNDIAIKLLDFTNRLPTVDTIEGCKDCDVRYFCGNGCWACTYWQRGSFSARNPYCDFYKRYWSAVIWNLGKEHQTEAILSALEQGGASGS